MEKKPNRRFIVFSFFLVWGKQLWQFGRRMRKFSAKKKGKVCCFYSREEERKRYMEREVSPYNRLGSLTYAEPPLHAISTTISPRLAPFVLRPTERSSSSLSFEMHRCIRSLHNYYDYREQQLARCGEATSHPPIPRSLPRRRSLQLVPRCSSVTRREMKKRKTGGLGLACVCVCVN